MIARIVIAVLSILLLRSTPALAEGSAESQSVAGRNHAHGDEAKRSETIQSNSQLRKDRNHNHDSDDVSVEDGEKRSSRTRHSSANQSRNDSETRGDDSTHPLQESGGSQATDRPVAGDDRPATVVRSSDSKKNAESIEKRREPSKRPTVIRAKGAEKEQPHAYRGVAPCLAWVDRTKPISAVLVCVHGLGLHNGTYEAFGKRMSELGYATYAIDVRGFGAWMQAKGRERIDFEHCINDVRTTLKVVRRAHPNCPVFLLGESMGGAIALRVTSMYPELVDGLISSVPAGDRFKHAKTSLRVGFHLIKNADKPINVGDGVVKQATKNPELRKVWLEDPLARLDLTPRELIQFQNFMNGNQECAENIRKTAVLIVQGCQDKLVRPEGTVELFNHLATADREIVLIPNAEHLIFEEAQFTDKEIATVDSWIAAHLRKLPQSGEGSEEKKADPTGAVKGDLE